MIKFNLEKALAGEDVIDGEGKPVTQLHLFDIESEYKLYGVVGNSIVIYTVEGIFNIVHHGSSKNLFMVPKPLKGFINIYLNEHSARYLTRELADIASSDDRIACIDLSQFNEGEGL